ncbi:MAG: choice-of-anchor D domain-containing protein [Myxococcales bacterium]|nr:choice-of-anchor D domain-containing protein [Myxococcales bacterium]
MSRSATARQLLATLLALLASCGDGAAPGDDVPIACSSDDNCPAGQSCSGGLCAAPADAGADAPGAPDLVVSPTELDFGSPLLGAAAELELTLQNAGSGALSITQLELRESDSLTEFTVLPSGGVVLTLEPGASTTILVTLLPADAEADLGELRIHSNDPDSPQLVVPLHSEVKGAALLAVDPDEVDFGIVVWGTTRSAEVDLANRGTGNAPLEVLAVSLTDDSDLGAAYTFELLLVDPSSGAETPATLPLYLAPGVNATLLRARITVDTTALGAGPLPAESLVIATDLATPAGAERRVPLTGNVLGCAAPAAESCNGVDDDCDLAVDEGNPGGAVACATGLLGTCAAGTTACLTGALACVPDAAPTPETCDGVDSNCDGVVDGGLVRTCDLGCATGIEFCVAGVFTGCTADAPTPEICNGRDDDCDPTTVDGSAEPLVGTACDGVDADLCPEGAIACLGSVLACVEVADNALDLCNGVDDDCTPATADGSAEPSLDAPCDGTDSDLCAEGTRRCILGALLCTDGGADRLELCNGVDDDCDPTTADGSSDPTLLAGCDGADDDLCNNGVRVCSGGALSCTDGFPSLVELCNGVDDDCNPATADGSAEPSLGTPCDGTDADLCVEGTVTCATGVLLCTDWTGATLDLCGGGDDDCDPASTDGSEDPAVGAPCDGADSDLCPEGTRVCSAGSLSCNDGSSATLDLCNGLDDDCDGASADGAEGPGLGVACDGADGDLCDDGLTACTAGAIACNDPGPALVSCIACDGLDNDADVVVDEDDEGCTPPLPVVTTTAWTQYDFSYYNWKVGCTGLRYVRRTSYSTGRYVGVVLCSPTRYKIFLSDDLAGTFYSIGDGCGSGEDHCEFVGGVHSAMSVAYTSPDSPGYTRCSEGQTPSFGRIRDPYWVPAWSECSISIP